MKELWGFYPQACELLLKSQSDGFLSRTSLNLEHSYLQCSSVVGMPALVAHYFSARSKLSARSVLVTDDLAPVIMARSTCPNPPNSRCRNAISAHMDATFGFDSSSTRIAIA